MAFPEIPGQLRLFFEKHTPGFWNWYQDALQYWSKNPTVVIEGLDADKPVATGSGMFYYATDTEKMYYDPRTQ